MFFVVEKKSFCNAVASDLEVRGPFAEYRLQNCGYTLNL